METPAAVLELIRSQELTDLLESEFQGLVTPGPSSSLQFDPPGLPILSSFPFTCVPQERDVRAIFKSPEESRKNGVKW